MNKEKKFDLAFWESSYSFFKKYYQQKNEVLRLFEEVSNSFPVENQKQYFTFTKGNKVSQGYNLDGFPYQVLDLVRDFDSQQGFNVRIMNWVGKGLFIFVYVGWDLTESFLENLSGSKDLPNAYLGIHPFRYSEIIRESKETKKTIDQSNQEDIPVFWESIDLQERFDENLNILVDKINRAFEYTR